ncbi:MAG: hypothetical protein JW940_11295 [Polyangiaceae bacterium]|nr:hypothetical protein [Polyangiaceae bacterium]
MSELCKADQGQTSGGFGAQEPSSFCSRETPVIPIPTESLLQASGVEPLGEAQIIDRSDDGQERGRSGSGPGASLAPAPSSRPSRAMEQDFWDKPPAYSLAPHSLWPHSARPGPPGTRSRLAWLLFILVLTPVVVLFAHVLSTQYGIRWLDVQVLLRWIGLST